MSQEVDDLNQEEEKDSKKKSKKKIPSNHRSADDMDFNEPEYLQVRVRDEIKEKQKVEKEKAENGVENVHEEEEVEEEDQEEGEEENGTDEDEEDGESSEDDEEDASLKENADFEAKFEGDQWVGQFEEICTKLNKKTIQLVQFEKSIRLIIEKLDPGKHENNKERLCLLTQRLVEYYQSLFELTSLTQTVDFKLVKLCTIFIYELTSKYGTKSTRKEPSVYLNLFKKILNKINDDFVNLKVNERKFPSLSVVSLNFHVVSTLTKDATTLK